MQLIMVKGQAVPLETRTYLLAIQQMIDVLGEVDEMGAAAWYVRYYDEFLNVGLSYRFFMQKFRESGESDVTEHVVHLCLERSNGYVLPEKVDTVLVKNNVAPELIASKCLEILKARYVGHDDVDIVHLIKVDDKHTGWY